MYSALRDHDPVHHLIPPEKPDHDYWLLSRHADVWQAARDNETFSSAQGLTVNYGELELIGLQDNPPFVMQDPPVHTEFRKLVSRGFTPRQVEAVEPKVRVALTELLARCPDFEVDESGIVWAGGSYVRRPLSVPFRVSS
jgi:cytochrome P450 family 130